MRSLSKNREQLIFDYCFGLTSEERTAQVEALIACNRRAADIHARIQAALGPLESLHPEPCPEELAERTIGRLIEAKLARSGQEKLNALFEKERTRSPTRKFSFWGNFGDVVAAAAVVMLLAAVLVPSLGYARQKYWQQRCQVQLGSIFQGLSSYASDHNGRLPAVATKAGDPWWKVGRPGDENHSNTRPAWLLVKNDYVGPEKFVCPAARQVNTLEFGTLQVQNYDDFPGRAYMGFSFRVGCPKAESSFPNLNGREVFMADMNPLAERFPSDYSSPVKIRLSDEMLTFNSANHNRRGQNMMFCDGSIQFTKTRHVGDPQDDIFSLQEMQCGCEVNGCEVPSCETDVFLF